MRAAHARRADRSTVLLWVGLLILALLAVVPLLATVGTSGIPVASSSQPASVQPVMEPGQAPGPDLATVPAVSSGTADRAAHPATEGVGSPEALVVRRREPAAATPRLGRVGALELHHPSPAPLAVGFHEAATSRALPMRPLGRIVSGGAIAGGAVVGDTVAGWPYRVLPSRGRRALPTSAVDVALPDGEPVLAPISGEVVDVGTYHLEGRYPDRRIEIRPDAAPTRRVVVIHVAGVQVAAGDRVEGGRTPLARTARRFPFVSQIDTYTAPEHWPHVHIEVQPEPPPDPPETSRPDAHHAATALGR